MLWLYSRESVRKYPVAKGKYLFDFAKLCIFMLVTFGSGVKQMFDDVYFLEDDSFRFPESGTNVS